MIKAHEKLMTISNFIYQLLILNFLFLLSNCLFFEVFFRVDFKLTNFPIYFMVMLPLGPSLMALFQTIQNVFYEKQGKSITLFFSSYKQNVKESMKIWFVWLCVFFLSLVSLYYPTNLPPNLKSLFQIMQMIFLVLEILFLAFLLPIVAKFSFSMASLIKVTLYYTIKKGYIGVMVLSIFFLLVYLTQAISFVFILFLFSVTVWISLFLFQHMLLDIQHMLTQANQGKIVFEPRYQKGKTV